VEEGTRRSKSGRMEEEEEEEEEDDDDDEDENDADDVSAAEAEDGNGACPSVWTWMFQVNRLARFRLAACLIPMIVQDFKNPQSKYLQ
jgi:hypothetical protein